MVLRVLSRIADGPGIDEAELRQGLLNRRFTRREVFQLAAVAGTSAWLLSACTPESLDAFLEKIRNRPRRRNIASLPASDPYVAQYATVVREMKSRSQANASDPTGWQAFVDLHRDWCPHGTWLWLPWHRELLFRFERIAQDILGDASFAVPYWNWTEQRSIPPAFQSGDLSHPGRTLGTLSAAAGGGPEIDAAMGLSNFEAFASFKALPLPSGTPTAADQKTRAPTKGRLESPTHDQVHVQVGGDMYWTNLSPKDPIFYTHHGMLDYLWVKWNEAGKANTSDPAWVDWSFQANPFPNPDGTLVNSSAVTPGWTMIYPALSYQYEASTVGTGP